MKNKTAHQNATHRAHSRPVSAAVLAGVVTLAWFASKIEAQAPVLSYSVFHDFASMNGGAVPVGGLVADSGGELYGTVSEGGDVGGTCPFSESCGLVFKLDPAGNETVLHKFSGKADGDGAVPFAGVIRDSGGNLFGTTLAGGSTGRFCIFAVDGGCGVVFKVDSLGNEQVLHLFGAMAGDGAAPDAALIEDSAGHLYGTTSAGGNLNNAIGTSGCGVVFKLDPQGRETVLYSFKGVPDGAMPGALTQDSQGNLYGTTTYGGNNGSTCYNAGSFGCGVVYKLDQQGNETVLYRFTGAADGAEPYGGVIRDPAGNLTGTTRLGGNTSTCPNGPSGCGVVFKLDPLGHETVLHTFTGGLDGEFPFGNLLMYHGVTYGAAQRGGAGDGGVIFKLQP